jgi:hypothetical protein
MLSSTGCNRRLGPSKCSVNLGGGGLRRCAGLCRWGCCGCGRGITLAARSSELRGLEYCCSRVGCNCQPVNILSSALSRWDHTQLSVGGASRVSVGCRSEEVALFAIRRSWSVVYEERRERCTNVVGWGGRRALYTHRRGIVAHAMISSQSPGWAGKIQSLVGLARATASGHCYGEICGRGTVCVLSLRPSGRASPASTRCRHIECRYTE